MYKTEKVYSCKILNILIFNILKQLTTIDVFFDRNTFEQFNIFLFGSSLIDPNYEKHMCHYINNLYMYLEYSIERMIEHQSYCVASDVLIYQHNTRLDALERFVTCVPNIVSRYCQAAAIPRNRMSKHNSRAPCSRCLLGSSRNTCRYTRKTNQVGHTTENLQSSVFPNNPRYEPWCNF